MSIDLDLQCDIILDSIIIYCMYNFWYLFFWGVCVLRSFSFTSEAPSIQIFWSPRNMSKYIWSSNQDLQSCSMFFHISRQIANIYFWLLNLWTCSATHENPPLHLTIQAAEGGFDLFLWSLLLVAVGGSMTMRLRKDQFLRSKKTVSTAWPTDEMLWASFIGCLESEVYWISGPFPPPVSFHALDWHLEDLWVAAIYGNQSPNSCDIDPWILRRIGTAIGTTTIFVTIYSIYVDLGTLCTPSVRAFKHWLSVFFT